MDLSDQKTQIMFLVIAAVIGGIYVWFTYLYTPRADRISELEGERDQLVADIQRLELEVARLPRVEAQLNDARQRWAEVLVSFPTEPREEEVIANLNASEQTSGLFISGMTKAGRRTRPLYFEQDYTLNVVGEYSELSRFIQSLIEKPRRMSVQRMKLTHPSATQAAGGASAIAPFDEEVIMTLTVTTYIVRATATGGGG